LDFNNNNIFYRTELILIFCLFFSSFVLSQNNFNIRGIVKDSITQENIEYANVVLLSEDSSFIKGATTDSVGYFSINISPVELKSSMIMQFNLLGYKKKFLLLNRDLVNRDSLLVFLSPTENYLSEVQILGKVTLINNLHNRMEYKVSDKLRENSLLATQILENIPSVFVDFNKNIYVNGSSNILILKNGQEISSNSIVNQIPVASIERVEIWKNIPIKYASQNYSAILNIITKRILNKSLLLDNNISFDKSMYDSKVNLNLDLPKHSVYLFYKLYYRNFLEKSSIENNLNQPINDTIYRFSTKPRIENQNEFFYGYSYYFNKRLTLGVDGYLSLYKQRFISNYDNIDNNADYSNLKEDFNTQNYKAYLNYNDSINTLNANLNYNHVSLLDNILYYENNVSNKQRDERNTWVSQIDYRRQIRNNIDLSAGINYSNIFDNNQFTNILQTGSDSLMQYKGSNLSLYAESNIEIKKLSFDVGLNLFNYERNFSGSMINVSALNLYPKISISYHLKSNTFQIDYYSYINNPSIWQMLPLTQQSSPNVFFNGNPYLKPEKYNVSSFEYNYSQGDFYITNNFYYKLAQNKIQNIIYEEDKNEVLMSYINLNNRKDFGYSISLTNKLTNWWSINFFNNIYYRTIDENTFYKKNMLSYTGNIQSVWEITKKLTFGGYYQYNTKTLVYNGSEKPYNSSLLMVKFKLTRNIEIYILATQPFGQFKKKSEIYSENGKIYLNSNLKVATYLFSFTYNLFYNNKNKQKNLFYNEETESKKN